MKYIDAEKLIAEIERRLKIVEPHKDTFESAAACSQELIWMKDFILSLQQDQPEVDFPEVDFDEEFNKFHIGMYNPFNSRAGIYEFARHFANWGAEHARRGE